MATIPPRFVEACARLGFELHAAPMPFLGGVDHAWHAEREAGLVVLRVRAIDGELCVGARVLLKRRLRCGLRATTIRSYGTVELPGEQLADHLLPGWFVRAVDVERARRFLERFREPLGAARKRGMELELTDEATTAWFTDALDEASLAGAVAATERLAARLDRRAAKVKPPRWLRQVEARWPSFAEARGLDLDAGDLRMTGSARSTSTYRDSRERRVAVWVQELDHAAPQVGVRVDLTRSLTPSASFTPAEAVQGGPLEQLVGLQVFADAEPTRFAVMAPSEGAAAPLRAPEVSRTLEQLPAQVVRGHLEGAVLDVFAGEVVTAPDALAELVDAAVELAERLEEHAPEAEPLERAPALAPTLPVPAVDLQEAASRRRAATVWLAVATIVAAMLVLGRLL